MAEFSGDLWGPLIICLLLSVFLSIASEKTTTTGANGTTDTRSTVFAASFVLLVAGSLVVTLNALLLGGTLYGVVVTYLISLTEKGIFPGCLYPWLLCVSANAGGVHLPADQKFTVQRDSPHDHCPRLHHLGDRRFSILFHSW